MFVPFREDSNSSTIAEIGSFIEAVAAVVRTCTTAPVSELASAAPSGRRRLPEGLRHLPNVAMKRCHSHAPKHEVLSTKADKLPFAPIMSTTRRKPWGGALNADGTRRTGRAWDMHARKGFQTGLNSGPRAHVVQSRCKERAVRSRFPSTERSPPTPLRNARHAPVLARDTTLTAHAAPNKEQP